MVGEWEALEQHQQYNVDSISLNSLVDDAWESLVRVETQLDAEDLQSFDTSDGFEHEAVNQSLLPFASDTAQQDRHEGAVEAASPQGAARTTSNLARAPRGSDAAGRAYMDSLTVQSGPHIITSARVTKAFQDNAEFGVFALFFTATFRSSLQTWTSNVLLSRGQQKLTDSEFNAYCGLEIAMSICPLTAIAEY